MPRRSSEIPPTHGNPALLLLTRSDSSTNVTAASGPPSTSAADRKLRHASTFIARGQESTSPAVSPIGHLVQGRSERQIQRKSVEMLAAELNLHPAGSASPLKKVSAKLERALQLKDQCERDLEKFCESKTRRRHYNAPASPTSCGALEGTLWLEVEKASDANAREKLALERLVRRIAPSLSNCAASHADLLHILHSCRECSTRLTFCSACSERASEFFSGYTAPELLALYGRDLPPADADALEAFASTVAAREARATRNSNDS